LVTPVTINASCRFRRSSNWNTAWRKMLPMEPLQVNRSFQCGKVLRAIGKTCSVITNTLVLEPPMINAELFIIQRYLPADDLSRLCRLFFYRKDYILVIQKILSSTPIPKIERLNQ